MTTGDYVLRNVTRQTYIINEYEPANRGVRSLLSQMISYGLKSFIDNHYFAEDGKVNALATADEFNESGSALVKNAVWIHDLPFSEEFAGFSPDVVEQARELERMRGMKILTRQSEQFDRKSGAIGLYAFQEMVYELKRMAIDEGLDFINQYLDDRADETQETRQYEYLPSEEFELPDMSEAETGLENLSLNPDLIFSEKKPPRRGRRNEFSQQVVELLEENNRILAAYSNRFEDLQSQIDEIRENNNRGLREEIADMRRMIVELGEERSSQEITDTDYFVFEKNEFKLSELQKARLNATVVELAKNPELKALITGFADKSGNSEYNAVLSRRRAESVRDHLLNMGISESRTVLTYFGDTESTSVGAADRRVEVSLFKP